MGWRIRVLVIPTVLLVVAAPPSLFAQPSKEAKARANEILSRAYDAFDSGRHADAAKLYLEFFRLVETEGLPLKADLLYNAAIVFEHLGECDRVAELLTRYRSLEPKAKMGEVARRLEEARACAPEVIIESDPGGAMVHIDGRARGVTPLTLHLRSGVHTLRLELSGHRAHEEAVAIEARKPVALRRALVAEARSARIALDLPELAIAYLDGVEIGRGPYHGIREVAPGTHRLRVERAGCEARDLTIEAPPGGEPLRVDAAPMCAAAPAIADSIERSRPSNAFTEPLPVVRADGRALEAGAGLSTWVLISGGVGAAALVGGGVFTALAFSAQSDRDDANDLTAYRDAEGRRADFDRLQKVALGTALAGLIALGAIYVLDLDAGGEGERSQVEVMRGATNKGGSTRAGQSNLTNGSAGRAIQVSW